jgi:hypothetical protein
MLLSIITSGKNDQYAGNFVQRLQHNLNKLNDNINKINNVYFNFNKSLKDKLNWLNTIYPVENQIRLSTYKFCICPEGDGVYSHRLWECLYLKVVPIVIKSKFTSILEKQTIPLVILENWCDFDINKLN